jgi:hypothetical protein
MRGTLIKTEQGWIVEFYLKVEGEIVGIDKFPLHPDQEKYMHLTGKKPNGSYIHDGKEVNFIPIIDAKINMVQNFAKIIQPTNLVDDVDYKLAIQELVDEVLAADDSIDIEEHISFLKKCNVDDKDINNWVKGYKKAAETLYTKEQMIEASKYGYEFRDTTSFPEHKFEDSCVNNTKQWLQSLK